jgi:hypothetical protein
MPHGHHIITQQQMRKQCAMLELDFERYRWDKRNLLPLCERHHARHHSKIWPISIALVFAHAPKVLQVARELECEWWLSREYPVNGGERGTPEGLWEPTRKGR